MGGLVWDKAKGEMGEELRILTVFMPHQTDERTEEIKTGLNEHIEMTAYTVQNVQNVLY